MLKILISLFLFVNVVCGLYLADEVINLPGTENLGPLNFRQFSGYLQILGVNGKLSKNMHYWFVQSQSDDAANDPLTFWTNGGPGCSGLIGFATEQGPFRPQADGNITTTSTS
jgi:carboxypeptidase C (cathepsin A)